MSEIQKFTNNKEIITYLAEKFPLCFSLEGEAKPLKIGLFQDLAEVLNDDERVSKTQLRHALRQYTTNWRYLHGIKAGAVRVDLQGNPAGEVEAEHAEHAANALAEAKAKIAGKRAQKQAENLKTEKKRTARKNHHAPRNPKFELKPADISTLQINSKVKIKAGERIQHATILEITKESARVELENGLIINITPDRLFS